MQVSKTTYIRPVLQGVCLFVAAYAVVALTIHFTLIGKPLSLYAEIRSEKLAMLDERKNRLASAAFGSSHVHNGFDPRVFDRDLNGGAGRGDTLNLAIEGGSQTEQYAMASRFVDQMREQAAPPASCLVLLEVNAGANTQAAHLTHPRAINLYNADVTALSLAFADKSRGLVSVAGRMAYSSAASALHYMSVGMLGNAIFVPPLKADLVERQSHGDRRGLLSEPDNAVDLKKVAAMVAADHSGRRTESVSLTPGHERMLDGLARSALPRRPTLIYFVSPMLDDLNVVKTFPDVLQRPFGVVPVLNVARPDLYPELYQAKLWHDPTHLNEAGAAVFTRLLAREVKRWSVAHGSQLSCEG